MEDKKLYSYKEALEQPNWVRNFLKIFSFTTAKKFSFFVYFTISMIVFWLLLKIPGFIPWNYNMIFSAALSWLVAGIFEDLKVDGRPFAFYFKDYIIYYMTYGRKADSIYINKGKVYHRLDKKENKK